MSNSLLVDLDNEPGDVEGLKKQLTEASTAPKEPRDDKEQSPSEDDLPEKYRGKSAKEIAEMHMNAEKRLGQVGNEVGQYKDLTDRLLQLKRSDDLRKGGAAEEDIEDDEPEYKLTSSELLDDPTSAVSKFVDAKLSSQNRKKEKMDAEEREKEQARLFEQKHPDAAEIANSEEFVKWVSDSTTRSMTGYYASQGDLAAGDALLSEWKSSQEQTTSENSDENKKEDKDLQAARKASTESRGASTVADAPTGKTYRRLDLIRLKLTDPDAYADEGFQQEIMKAYAEGRVK